MIGKRLHLCRRHRLLLFGKGRLMLPSFAIARPAVRHRGVASEAKSSEDRSFASTFNFELGGRCPDAANARNGPLFRIASSPWRDGCAATPV
jgi:hypothetical protein